MILKEGEQIESTEEKINQVTERQEQEEGETEKAVQLILDFIETDFDQKMPLEIFLNNINGGFDVIFNSWDLDRTVKSFFQNKSFSEKREILRNEAIPVKDLILIFNEKIKEVEGMRGKIKELIKIGGTKMMPLRVRRVLELGVNILERLKVVLMTNKMEEDIKEHTEFSEGFREIIAARRADVMRQEEEIKEDIFPEQVKKKPVDLAGFEPINSYESETENFIMESLRTILPQRFSETKNIQEITYIDKVMPISKKYGINGSAAARYSPSEKKIIFYRPEEIFEDGKMIEIETIIHEAAHAFAESRVVSQEWLTMSEEVEMITDFEQVRKREKEFSSYVLGIRNKNKQKRAFLKSKESLAETITMYYTNPAWLQENRPKRFEFCQKWLEKP